MEKTWNVAEDLSLSPLSGTGRPEDQIGTILHVEIVPRKPRASEVARRELCARFGSWLSSTRWNRGRERGGKPAANQLLRRAQSTAGYRLEKTNASRACPVASLAGSTVLASSSCLPGDRVPPKWRDGSMGWRLPGPFQCAARSRSPPVRGLRTIPKTTLGVGKINAWVLTKEQRLDSQTNRSD